MPLPHRTKPAPAIATCIAVAALLVSGCGDDGGYGDGSAGAGSGQQNEKTVKLGSVFSTSGAGVAFGPQQLRGARLAAERINRAGGVDGTQLEIVQRDDEFDDERTPEVMRELIEELVFRDLLDEETAIPANIESLIGGGAKVAGAIVAYPQDDPFGRSTGKIAVRSFVANHATTAEIAFDDPAQLETLPGTPEAVMITASSGEVAADAIRAARAGGYEGPILGGNAFNSRLAAEQAGVAGAGARSAAAWYLGDSSKQNTEFVAAYRDAYGEEPDQFAAQAYTGVLLLAEAATAAKLSLADLAADRAALAKALAKVELETPLGRFRFTADHDVSQPIWIVEMDGRGGYEPIERLEPRGP